MDETKPNTNYIDAIPDPKTMSSNTEVSNQQNTQIPSALPQQETPAPSQTPQANSANTQKPTKGNEKSSNTNAGKKSLNPLKNLKNLSLPFKLLLGSVGFIAFLYIAFATVMLTGIDTQLIKLSFTGELSSVTGEPITNAEISFGGNNFTTGPDGKFTITGLEIGRYQLEINAEGFEPLSTEVALNRSLLDYTTERSFELQPTTIGTVTGQLIADDEEYAFSEDTLTINDQEVEIALDGSFQVPEIETGERLLQFQSLNFQDLQTRLDIDTGSNTLQPIELVPAGDILGSAENWLTEEIVQDFQVLPENVTSDFINYLGEGKFAIKDLEIGKTYLVRVQAEGFATRDYEVEITQGENFLPNLRLVPEGQIPYLSKVENEFQIFASDLDGAEALQLTSLEDMEPYAEYLASEAGLVYFLSTRDNVSSDLGGKAPLVYAVPIAGGNPQRVSTQTEALGRVIPNFSAKKLLNVRRGEENQHRVLEVLSLEGEVEQELFYTEDGTFNDIVLSDDAETVYFHVQNRAGDINGLYAADVSSGETEKLITKPSLQIYDVSADGDFVLYSATNPDTELLDLFLYQLSTQQDTRLRQSFTGSQYQFVGDRSDLLIYFDLVDQRSNVFQFNLENNEQTRLTDFSGQEAVEAVYQQAGYVLYQTNVGLYVLDVDKPVSGKLVTEDVARYTGYDF